jgi:hypothetical protein
VLHERLGRPAIETDEVVEDREVGAVVVDEAHDADGARAALEQGVVDALGVCGEAAAVGARASEDQDEHGKPPQVGATADSTL